MIFFVISGFLVTMSYEKSRSNMGYLKKRCLRIFPGLCAFTILAAFLAGPLVTSLPITDYLTRTRTFTYLLNVSLYKMQYTLPGVFENNPIRAVNGSLWTLSYEFTFYLVVLALGASGLLRKSVVLPLFLCSFIVPMTPILFHARLYFSLLADFSGGMLLYLYKDVILVNGKLAILSGMILVFTLFAGGFKMAFAAAGSYLVVYLAFAPWLGMNNFGRWGDLSYGIYIYAFPVQQAIIFWLREGGGWVKILAISYPIVLLIAALSWHLVEKRALLLKSVKLS